MTEQISSQLSGTTWFVGASFGHTDDQSARFLEEGIWEISSPSQKGQALVRSMRPGERIAIKAAYVRKHGLPFDNRQQTVSVMGIKATGVITENSQDGERVKVQWQPADGVREWYFYTYRPTSPLNVSSFAKAILVQRPTALVSKSAILRAACSRL